MKITITMEELKSIKSAVQTEVSKNEWGTFTTIKYPKGISTKFSQVAKDGQTILVAHLYNKNETYKVVYILVNANGEVADVLHETAGIQPTLFFSPTGDLWTSVSPYHPDKEGEVSIPFYHRTNFPEPKNNRQFAGKYVGTTDTAALLHDTDLFSDTRPDKLLRIDFKNGKLKAKKNLKIPMPKGNKIIIDGNTIHLYRFEGKNSILYRTLDENANVANEQKIIFSNNTYTHFQVLKVTHREIHYFALSKMFAYIGTLTLDGLASEEAFPTNIEMYNLFTPIKINDSTFAISFNWQEGNGWAIVQNARLRNFFVRCETGYQCLMTNEILPLPGELILSAISALNENMYSIVFYPNTDRKQNVYVLNKVLS